MIPNYLTWKVVCKPAHEYLPKSYTKNSTEIVYWISTATGKRLERISFVILALCSKILPVFILLVFSMLLILNVRQIRQLRKYLRYHYSSIPFTTLNLNREARITTMLVLITLFTTLVEFPQGVLFIASGINKDFFFLYSHLGDIWDITSISSSFITFITYCLMSRQFRKEICRLFRLKYPTKYVAMQKNNDNRLTEKMNLKLRGTASM